MSTSSAGDWRKSELRELEGGRRGWVPYEDGKSRLREHPISLRLSHHEHLRDKANEIREEMGE